jgi:transposase
MARGFESKSVQDQQDEAERARHASSKPALTPEEIARQTKKEGLLLSRTRTLNQLQGACDGRYRALLETTLKHIDDELAALAASAKASTPVDAPPHV